MQGAIEKFRAAKATNTDLGINVETEIADVRRKVATDLAQQGEALAKAGDFPAAEAKFKAALELEPPPDTPVYVYVPAGSFTMGAGAEDEREISRSHSRSNFHLRETAASSHPGRLLDPAHRSDQRPVLALRGSQSCEPPADGNIRYRMPSLRSSRSRASTGTRPERTLNGQAAGCLRRRSGRRRAEEAWRFLKTRWWVGGQRSATIRWIGPIPGARSPTNGIQPEKRLLNFAGTGLGTWSAVGSYPKEPVPTAPWTWRAMCGNGRVACGARTIRSRI